MMKEQRRKRNKSKKVPYLLAYIDLEEFDEFQDMATPRDYGRRRPRHDEWGCYIEDEQMLHIENLMCGLIADISHMTVAEIRKTPTLGNLGGIKHGPQLES